MGQGFTQFMGDLFSPCACCSDTKNVDFGDEPYERCEEIGDDKHTDLDREKQPDKFPLAGSPVDPTPRILDYYSHQKGRQSDQADHRPQRMLPAGHQSEEQEWGAAVIAEREWAQASVRDGDIDFRSQSSQQWSEREVDKGQMSDGYASKPAALPGTRPKSFGVSKELPTRPKSPPPLPPRPKTMPRAPARSEDVIARSYTYEEREAAKNNILKTFFAVMLTDGLKVGKHSLRRRSSPGNNSRILKFRPDPRGGYLEWERPVSQPGAKSSKVSLTAIHKLEHEECIMWLTAGTQRVGFETSKEPDALFLYHAMCILLDLCHEEIG